MPFSTAIASSLSSFRLYYIIFVLIPVLFDGIKIIDCP